MVNLDFGCPLSIVLLAEQITLLEFSVLLFKSSKPGKHFQKELCQRKVLIKVSFSVA